MKENEEILNVFIFMQNFNWMIKFKERSMKFYHILKKYMCFYKIEAHHKFEFQEALS